MNDAYCSSFRLASTLALIFTISGSANAQEAGANMATPAPARSPAAMSAPGTTVDATPSTAAGATSSEPMIDPETTRQTFPNRPLLITGAVVFGGSYGASVIFGALSNREADKKLYYPLVGPWLNLNDRGCDVNPCSNKTLSQVLLVGDGIAQGLGALSILLSVVVPETKTRSWYLIGNENLVVAPQLGGSTLGVGAAGRF